MRRANIVRLAVASALAVAAIVGLFVLPVAEYAESFSAWLRGLGNWGLVLLVAVYTPAYMCLPGSILTPVAGAAFGLWRAMIGVSIASVAAATLAFLAARTLFRGVIEERIAGNPKFAALDRAVAQQGFKIVLLTRLSPVFPYLFLNYAFGLTRVSLRDYVLASWIGMLPGTIMYVYLGTAITNVADLFRRDRERTTGKTALFFLGLAVTVVLTVFITRVAKRALSKAVMEQAEGEGRLEIPIPESQAAGSSTSGRTYG